MSSVGVVSAIKIELTSPFPPEFHRDLFNWVYEFPERTMDDFWPKDFETFAEAIDQRSAIEQTFLVSEDGKPVGFIGYQRCSPHLGSLRGVFFSKEVHGNGTAARALRKVLQQEFDEGVFKVLAFPFSDNGRSIAFYKKLGAIQEGHLTAHTTRNGKPIDMLLLAFFAPQDGYSA